MSDASGCPAFDCCECGRPMIVFYGEKPEPPLCSACLANPGWLDVPEMRRMIDPEGHVREPDYSALPIWTGDA